MSEFSSKSPINLDLKTEIPSEESGRTINALTDIVRFFSEPMGLVADHIRVHREDVLIKVAQKTRERLEIAGDTPRPIPNKFMVPFLERASCEDLESEMIDLWAGLLAKASASYDESLTGYVSVLSELGPKAATLFRNLVLEGKTEEQIRQFQKTTPSEHRDEIRSWIGGIVRSELSFSLSGTHRQRLVDQLAEEYEFSMTRFREIELLEYIQVGAPVTTVKQSAETFKYSNPASTLFRLGLIEEHQVEYNILDQGTVSVSAVWPSYSGIELILTCERFA